MSIRLDTPLQTPSGVVFENRLVKAAMAEGLADEHNDPSDKYISLYSIWSSGGWGAVITGEMEVSTIYLGSPNNIASPPTPSQTTRDKWTRWALAAQQHTTPALVQLVHPGRQSPAGCGQRSLFSKAIAPSPIPVSLGPGLLSSLLSALLFGTPREMSDQEIREVIQQFAAAAKLCYESGFKGVQIHAAHGFLLTQFMSAKTNRRGDAWGGTPARRVRIVVEIIRAIRAVVPASFCIGLKINSADVGGQGEMEEALEQVGIIVKEGVDFLEISGGTIEKMRMVGGDGDGIEERVKVKASTAAREAFFLDYARAVRARYPNVLLMVTGGFRSRRGMQEALDSGACDLIGLGRPSAIWPNLPKEVLLNKKVEDEDAKVELRLVRGNWFVRNLGPKTVGAGMDVLYYAEQIARLAMGRRTAPPPVGA